jgi:hypothetical protein
MNAIHTSLLFSEWALEFLFVPPICFLFGVAAISWVWAAQKQQPFRRGLWKRYHWLMLSHAVFFLAAIALGVIWANPNTNPTVPHSVNQMASRSLDLVLYGSIISCLFWIWKAQGFRWYASSFLALAELPIWGAVFVAGMSISGRWL